MVYSPTDAQREKFKEWAAKALPPELWQWAEMDLNSFAAIAIMFAEFRLSEARRDSERLESSLRESLLRGYLFDCAEEPLNDYGKRIVRVVLSAMSKKP